MSYKTWTTYGFGFCVDDILRDVALTPKKILELAAMEPSVLNIVHEYLNEICEDRGITYEELDVNDFEDLEGDYCEHGIAFILYNVITDIPVVYANSYDGDQYILYCPSYPWNLTEQEKSLTREKIEEIFQKYISVLTDEYIEIDRKEVENGG